MSAIVPCWVGHSPKKLILEVTFTMNYSYSSYNTQKKKCPQEPSKTNLSSKLKEISQNKRIWLVMDVPPSPNPWTENQMNTTLRVYLTSCGYKIKRSDVQREQKSKRLIIGLKVEETSFRAIIVSLQSLTWSISNHSYDVFLSSPPKQSSQAQYQNPSKLSNTNLSYSDCR